ncbi:MAG: U32 family peptidase [Methanomicrobium sp.]|nr:U32 family peptidase [Methanomicrobium sp.]
MSGMSGSRGGRNSREKKVKKSVKPVSSVSPKTAKGEAKTGAEGKGEKIRIPELLAPAGSPEALHAAVCAGADAVYLSGRNFGARRFAANFNEDELKDAVEYCHTRGVRVYVTLNTLISDEEMPRALSEMMYYCSIGADAVLVQDLGLLKAAGECFPDLVLHASTQMTINSTAGALKAGSMNIRRIVLARELSYDEIAGINAALKRAADPDSETPLKNPPELEVFVHGALCYCYSGQCLFSSLLGGRSGNRGMCAQPCRKAYELRESTTDRYGKTDSASSLSCRTKGAYLLSPRDLCSYDNLEKMARLNIASLKIEGRMKSPEYVAIVTSIYRRALDAVAGGAVSGDGREDMENLLIAFNRRFTSGYIGGDRNAALMSYDRPANRGIFIGTVIDYDPRYESGVVRLTGDTKPRPGDGLTIRRKHGADDGFFLRKPYEIRNGELRFRSKCRLGRGDQVFITNRGSLDDLAGEIKARDGGIYRKIPIDIAFKLGGENGRTPVVRGSFAIKGVKYEAVYTSGTEMADAQNKPVMTADLEKVFAKCGGTQYEMRSFKAEYSDNLFLPMSLLNELRRNFLKSADRAVIGTYLPDDASMDAARENYSRFMSNFRSYDVSVRKPKLAFYADSPECVRAAADSGCDRIYCECDIAPVLRDGSLNPAFEAGILETLASAAEICKDRGCELIWKWSRIADDAYISAALPLVEKVLGLGVCGIMVESYGSAAAIRRIAPYARIYGGSGMNIYNSLSLARISDLFCGAVISPEASAGNIRDLIRRIPPELRGKVETEYLVNGAVELMITENNLPVSALSDYGTYDPKKTYSLLDERDRDFPLYVDACGRTHIFNAVETCLIDSLPELCGLGLDTVSVDGRHKTYDYASAVVKAYKEGLRAVNYESRSGRALESELDDLKKKVAKISQGGITEGHFRRGV